MVKSLMWKLVGAADGNADKPATQTVYHPQGRGIQKQSSLKSSNFGENFFFAFGQNLALLINQNIIRHKRFIVFLQTRAGVFFRKNMSPWKLLLFRPRQGRLCIAIFAKKDELDVLFIRNL